MAIFDLPGYDIMEKIGEGGMATVWRAVQTSLDRSVAIKILMKGLSENAEDRERFKSEIRSAARISHPNVVQAYDAGEHAGLVYYIMEYVKGCTVSDLLIIEEGIDETQALFITERLAEALGFCWKNHMIIHCDIKPENVMIDAEGTIKLADLGLARMIGLTSFKEDDELTIGTPQYMSPEQALAEEELDCRSDIYALGAMLYHMVTGRAPFEDQEPEQVLHSQLNGYLPDPLEVNPSISPGLAWMIERMMCKNRKDRQQDWEEVLEDIAMIRQKYMVGAGVFPAGLSTVQRSERRPVLVPKPKSLVMEKPKVTGGKKKIVLNKGQIKKLHADRPPARRSLNPPVRPSTRDAAKASYFLMFSMVLAIALYGFTFVRKSVAGKETGGGSGTIDPTRIAAAPAPDPDPAPKKPAGGAGMEEVLDDFLGGGEPINVTGGEPAATQPDQPQAPAAWTNADYERARKIYSRAKMAYSSFLSKSANADVLDKVDKDCAEAKALFEKVKDEAPAELNINRLINQCVQLAADCRWSKQLSQ